MPTPRCRRAVPVTVVIATRNRRCSLLHTLDRLGELDGERPAVVVVDNGSDDGTARAARTRPGVEVLALDRNLGAVARNVGAARAATPYVAFADDDSWWEPGALEGAVGHFERCGRLALVQARILVGPERRPDPACRAMAASPLAPCPCGAGPSLLGFVACGAVVRRGPFLAAGGFDDTIGFLGEEALLAWDLAAAGHHLAYADDVVARHEPARGTDRVPARRAARQARNALLSTWMRRPWPVAAAATVATTAQHPAATLSACRRLPAALVKRRRLPAAVEGELRFLEHHRHGAAAGVDQ